MIIELDPLVALQRAMYTRLSADTILSALGVKIFDRVSQAHYPRIVIGEDRESPNDTECQSVADVYSTVRVYSDAVGKIEAKNVSARVRFLLTRASGFTVEGFQLSVGHCTNLDIEPHEDELITQAIIDFKYRLSAVQP